MQNGSCQHKPLLLPLRKLSCRLLFIVPHAHLTQNLLNPGIGNARRLHHLKILLFFHCRVMLCNLPITRTGFVMVIDDPACLQMRIDRHGTDIPKAALFQIFADPIRQSIADRNRALTRSEERRVVKPHVLYKESSYDPNTSRNNC